MRSHNRSLPCWRSHEAPLPVPGRMRSLRSSRSTGWVTAPYNALRKPRGGAFGQAAAYCNVVQYIGFRGVGWRGGLTDWSRFGTKAGVVSEFELAGVHAGLFSCPVLSYYRDEETSQLLPGTFPL